MESDRSNALPAADRPGSAQDGSDERLAEIRRTARQSASYGHHDRTIAEGNTGMPFAIMVRSAFGGSVIARKSDDRVPDIAIRPGSQRTPLSAAVNGTRWPGRHVALSRLATAGGTTEVMSADAV